MRLHTSLVLVFFTSMAFPAPATASIEEDGLFCGGSRPARFLDGNDMRTHATRQERIDGCTRLVRAEPREPRYLLARAEAYTAAGRHENAIADVDMALRMIREMDRPVSMYVLNVKAEALRGGRQWRSLLDHAEYMLGAFQGDDEPRRYRGLALARLGREREALEDLQLWHLAMPFADDDDAMALLRTLESRLGVARVDALQAGPACQDGAAAARVRKAACDRLIDKSDGDPAAAIYFHRGVALRKMGDADAAFADFRRFAARTPGEASTFRLVSQQLLLLGRPDEAVVEAQKAIELEPDSNASLFQRAKAYAGAGRQREAEADLQVLLERVPEGSADWRLIQENLDALRQMPGTR